MLHRTASPLTAGSARRLLALLGAVTLVAACGSGDSATTETSAAAGTTATTVATETTAAPAPPETTAAPSTTTTTIDERPVVVVTYSILGDIVSQLVGDTARVEVVVPDGSDPHEFSASAQDIEQMMSAAVVVANGLNLEEGLSDALGQVAAANVPLFEAAAHITVREFGKGGDDGHDHGHSHDEEEGTDDGHDHEGGDPHLWTSAATMAEMVPALTDALEAALAVDLATEEAEVTAALAALDSEVQAIIARIPAGACKLVTGHESLGYFADRYGCELIGAVIPSLSSTAETSAKELAELQRLAAESGVGAIFTEAGTPADVAEQVASAVGVPLVELPSHDMPDSGGYRAFLTELATRIADALA